MKHTGFKSYEFLNLPSIAAQERKAVCLRRAKLDFVKCRVSDTNNSFEFTVKRYFCFNL